MKNTVKLLIVMLLRVILRIFWIFPVKKNIILFSSFEGRQFSDNPKYLFLYIKRICGEKYKYVWVLNDATACPHSCLCVKFLSLRHIFYLCTSGLIVSNVGIEPFVPKRKKQIFVNTWHGSGAYKSQTLSDKFSGSRYNFYVRDVRARSTDYYISGCQKFSDVMAESWNAPIDKFIATGCPRNDMLFLKDVSGIRSRVFKELCLSDGCSYILYAPTFRGNSFRKHEVFEATLDMRNLVSACERRFGGTFVILFREHIGAFGKSHDSDCVVDVSSYHDMQELLLCADVLVTDYSSCMWDFAILNRPGFLFIPDFESYKEERDLYTPIETWPFPFAKSNGELVSLIDGFDFNENILRIKKHFSALGSFENGDACKNVCEKLCIHRENAVHKETTK